MDTLVNVLETTPLWVWAISIIGGLVFAGMFNIPARRRLLSSESDTRKMAMRYDALNFLVFFITFPLAGNMMFFFMTGNAEPVILNTMAFGLYSLAFWVMLRAYMTWKDRK